MGWTYSSSWPTKTAMIAHCTGPEMMGDSLTTLAKTVRGNALWTVIEYVKDASHPKGTRAILCFLLGSDVKRGGGWGYKDMDESMGPAEISCPVKYLDMVPDPGGYATAWRAKVRAQAAKRAVKIKVGDTLVLRAGCKPASLTVVSVKPLRAVANYTTYWVKRSLIERVEAA